MNVKAPAAIVVPPRCSMAGTGLAQAQGFAGLGADVGGFALVVPGKPIVFPADHGAHPDFRVEWWYVTANLNDAQGHSYGVQWTLFRQAVGPGDATEGWASRATLDGTCRGHQRRDAPVRRKICARWRRPGRRPGSPVQRVGRQLAAPERLGRCRIRLCPAGADRHGERLFLCAQTRERSAGRAAGRRGLQQSPSAARPPITTASLTSACLGRS